MKKKKRIYPSRTDPLQSKINITRTYIRHLRGIKKMTDSSRASH